MVSGPLAHLLVLVLLVAFPLWDRAEVRHLRATADPLARTRYYWRIIIVEWPLALFAVLLTGGAATFVFPLSPRPHWLPSADLLTGFTACLAVLPVVVVIAIAIGRAKGRPIEFYEKQLVAMNYLLPKTRTQQWLFVLLSITAGVCEEIVFRGFAMHYFAALVPLATPLVWLAATSLLFGIIHAGAGPVNIAVTALLGAVFGLLFLASGSLVLPIVLHAIFDARYALITAREPAPLPVAS